jgi:hypothetical protein
VLLMIKDKKIPEMALVGALTVLAWGSMGRPAVGRMLVELGVIDVLVATLGEVTPMEWVCARHGEAGQRGRALSAMKDVSQRFPLIPLQYWLSTPELKWRQPRGRWGILQGCTRCMGRWSTQPRARGWI